jgi:hypothetical protein
MNDTDNAIAAARETWERLCQRGQTPREACRRRRPPSYMIYKDEVMKWKRPPTEAALLAWAFFFFQ